MDTSYIPSPKQLKETYTKHAEWSSADRIPVKSIKIDVRLFSYQNKVCIEIVNDIINNFDIDRWSPILVNEDYYLLDGQHRLKAAKKMGLKYIDVIVQHVPNYSYHYKRAVKSIL